MKPEEVIKPEHVFFDAPVASKDEAMTFIASEAQALGITDDAEALKAALLHREEEMATGLAGGFAIPHTKTECVKRPAVLYVSLPHDIAWSSFDGSDLTVNRLFALLVPLKDAGTLHVELLSKLAVCLIDEGFCSHIAQIADERELAAYLCERVAAE